MAGYPGVLNDIQSLFPKARITSGYRGPNNPLTRRNPSSAHAHGNPSNPGAVDVAPIPGVTFGGYVDRLKAAGIPVTGALDEQAHPVAWSTGPNWHVSLDTTAPRSSPYYAAPKEQKPMISPQDLLARAQGFNVNIPSNDPPVMGQSASVAPQGAAQSLLAMLPDHVKKRGGPAKTLGTIAGILGDALMAYGGMQPQFGPNLAKQQEDDRQMEFDREKLNAMLEQKRQEALAPPQWLQDAQTFQSLPEPQRAAVLQYQDAVHPIFTATPQGTALNRRYNGPPPEAINELRGAVSQGDRGAVEEFEQVFGPGSARAYLGQ